jgi:hypothetical protein
VPFTPRDEVRLEISDTDVSTPLFSDAELDLLLERNSDSVLLAAAHACDILATRYASQVDFDALDQKSFKLSQRSKAYAAQARALRERASKEGGLVVQSVSRRDTQTDRSYLEHGRRDWPERCL